MSEAAKPVEVPEEVNGDMPEQAVPETVEEETPQEATATSEDDADDSEDREDDKPKRRSRYEERIGALTREKFEAHQRAEAAERRVQEIQQWLQQQQMQRMSEPPKLADYDYDEAQYQQAIQQWHYGQMQKFQRQQQEQARAWAMQQQQMQREEAIVAKAEEAARQIPDWREVVNDPSLPSLREINPAAFEAVVNSDKFKELTYYLAKNREELYSLKNKDPVSAIRTVAHLEAKLAAQPSGGGKAPPKPPSRVKGNAEAVKDPDKMPMNEWLEWRTRQLNQR